MKMTRISVYAVAWLTVLGAEARSPPGPTLADYVAKADLIVVGKLEPRETRQGLPVKPDAKGPCAFRYATVNIQIREVLKRQRSRKQDGDESVEDDVGAVAVGVHGSMGDPAFGVWNRRHAQGG